MNHHLFQPLLYQVAAAALSPGDIAVPIRAEFNKQKNVEVILGEVVNIDKEAKKVHTKDEEFEYDKLVVAIGNRHSYFGNDHWEKSAPGLKTLADALNIREKMLLSFEKAERAKTQKEREKYMTFVIVGGGPTGVEVAGSFAEIAKQTLLQDFRNIDTSHTRIILVEGMDRILQAYDPSLTDKAKHSLEKLGVEVRLNSMVKDVKENGVQVGEEFIETSNIIWAAGNKVSPLLEKLNTNLDKGGRVKVEHDCTLPDNPEIFVIGDAALFIEDDQPLPGIAPVAMQQGRYVAKILKNDLPKNERPPFHYFDKGNLATIGMSKSNFGKLVK
ncbi:MAG: NAD(P)/FAD-dependent oxidoreductase [Melioribacteraceae bacterium]|nr:NAD(P)/FAD-dependent oxidoreductase [Melioribacteraceae bacterium]